MVAAVAPLYRVRRRAPRRVTRDPAAALARIARTGIRTGEAVAAYGVRGPAPATYGKCRFLQEQNGCCPARYCCGGVASNFAEKGPARETSGHALGHLSGPAVNDGFSCDAIIRHSPGFFLYPSSGRSRWFDHWDYGIGIMERRLLDRLVGIIALRVPMTRVR